jgi:hypothetical protein
MLVKILKVALSLETTAIKYVWLSVAMARVITYIYIESDSFVNTNKNKSISEQTETVYLLTIYDKGEKTDLKPNELADIIESLKLD